MPIIPHKYFFYNFFVKYREANYMTTQTNNANTYNPQQIELDVQRYWTTNQCFLTTENSTKEKFYCLSMLPYPSGHIHMGHVRNYAIGDFIARYQRMLGKNVMQPFGWDAFGLPAENAALERKLAPSEWTYKNIEQMRKTIVRLGFAIDWSREFATCTKDYYRWEQWLFLRMYEKGLVYKRKSVVNWDPVDQTVLANEQVVDGRGWRSGAVVEQKEISQWFLKITYYVDELVAELDNLPGWPNEVKTMQRNWMGRSEGTEVDFFIPDLDLHTIAENDCITVFTTRPDTVLGVTYLAIAPQHPLALHVAKSNNQVKEFIEKYRNVKVAEADMATLPKEGVDSGIVVCHPITKKDIPVWIANFVLMDYGSGAVMSVPAHDHRDFAFAQKYGLPIQPVIKPKNVQQYSEIDYTQHAFVDKGILINSGKFDDLTSEEACKVITEYLTETGFGDRQVNYRLRDWGVSRQRYWGSPIPMINCPKCGIVPVPYADLPVVLPENVMLESPQSPLTQSPEFLNVTCPKCGGQAQRETDTFDTFMESSWYFARYCCPQQNSKMLDERANYWLPVDQYVGGIEHAVMHLLYARFIHKVMRDEGLVTSNEPFTRLLTQGMVLKDGSKMSKSKGNTVSPEEIIAQYGVDTARLFIIFASPPEQSLEWSDSGVEGAFRFLKRLWNFAYKWQATCVNYNAIQNLSMSYYNVEEDLRQKRGYIHNILQQVTNDIERQQFNTVVSSSMKLLNFLHEIAEQINLDDSSGNIDNTTAIIYEGMQILLCLLAPITPHIVHHLWEELHFSKKFGIILDTPWPQVDIETLKQDYATIIVQVNGKYRAKVTVKHNAEEKEVRELALNCEHVQRFIDNNNLKKIIFVKNKLLNIVCG